MHCVHINSLRYSILTQNYRHTGKQDNENGTTVFQLPVVVKFNYRRKESILSICHADYNGDVRFRCGCTHALSSIRRHLLRGSWSVCSYLSTKPTPFPRQKGEWLRPVYTTQFAVSNGVYLKTCLCRRYFWRNPWSWAFIFKRSLRHPKRCG